MKNVKNVKNEGLKLREFEILLRMIAGGKLEEPFVDNSILILPSDEKGNITGLPWSVSELKRYNAIILNDSHVRNINILEDIISKNEKDAITKAKKLYMNGKYEDLWRLLVGRIEYQNNRIKGIFKGVVKKEHKQTYINYNNFKWCEEQAKKTGNRLGHKTNITILSMLDVSETCLLLAKEANIVLTEEKKYDNYSRNQNRSSGKAAAKVIGGAKKGSVESVNTSVVRVSEGREK